MRYAPRRKIKKARRIKGMTNDYHLHIMFIIGDEEVLDVDDLSKPNETVNERCVMMARAGLLDNHYEDKIVKRKREWDLACDSSGLIRTFLRKGRWIKEVKGGMRLIG
jgi:hypothetical protein